MVFPMIFSKLHMILRISDLSDENMKVYELYQGVRFKPKNNKNK